MPSQVDNTIEFTFENKKAPDLAALTSALAAEGHAEAGIAEVAKPAPVAAKAPAEAVVETPDPAKAADLTAAAKPDDTIKTYKISVDGQEMEVTEADLKAGHMRHRDYTQKTQKISAREKELDARQKTWEDEIASREAALQQLDTFLRDRKAIEAYVAKAFGMAEGAPSQPPQLDPNKPPTLEDVAAIARYNAEQVRLSTLRDTRAEVEKAQEVALRALNQLEAANREKVENEVDRHMHAILDKFPILRDVSENIEDELMGDAARFLPKGSTLEDAKTRLSEAAERRAAKIAAIQEKAKKAEAIAKAELRKQGAEPAGGSAPKPVAAKKLSLDPKDRTARLAAAAADMEAYMQSGQLP